MSERDAKLLVDDILDSAQQIIAYTEGFSFEQFVNDRKTRDAVIRNFEIVGEAANRLSNAFKQNHPAVDWQRIKGFRNRIVHHYFGIDYSIVWQIKEVFLPQLISQLNEIRF